LQYGRKPRPVCPVHHIEMSRHTTRPTVRYFKCPVPGCDRSHTELRCD
jgi:hypothetical protein